MQNHNHTVHPTPSLTGRAGVGPRLILSINFLQALRHIRRNMGQSILIVGIISFALTAFVFSASSIWRQTHEASHIPDVEDVYRVQGSEPQGFRAFTYHLSDSLGHDILEHAPEDAKVGFIMYPGAEIISTNDTTPAQPMLRVNPEYYEVMRLEFISGRPASEDGEVVLTDKTALALFGTTDLVGTKVTAKFLREGGAEKTLRVVGVTKAQKPVGADGEITAYHYQKLEPTPANRYSYSPESMELFVRTKHPEQMQRALDETLERFAGSQYNDDYESFRLVPLRMGELLRNEGSFWKAAFYPGVFFILSTLLLLSALFSYLALLNTAADARWSDHRLRICLGGGKRDTLLRLQAEALLMFCAIGVLTFVLMTLTFDTYFEGMEITRGEVYLWFAGSLLTLLLVQLALCLLPVYVQNRRHRLALKGAPQGRPSALNYPLAVMQVAVSVLLLFLVWNGGRQIRFVTKDALGVNPERVYTFRFKRYEEKRVVNTNEFAQELCALSAVDTCVLNHPIFERGWAIGIKVDGYEQSLTMMILSEATIRLFDIKPNLWKPMQGEFKWQDGQVLLSSNAAAYYGVTPENPYINNNRQREVIGTLDLCTRDLHQEPELIGYAQDLGGSDGDSQLYFRILPGREKEGIAAVEEVLRRHDINPDAGTVRVVNYGDLIAEKYRKEQNFLWLYSVLSAVGLGIALFGMITLLSADLQRQRRAIAIRRVFGAHYRDCLRRTLRTYGIISALGTTLGLCVGYYLMTLWLRTYALQISLGILPALGIVALIALIVTALVAYKVKVCFKENPAEVIAKE